MIRLIILLINLLIDHLFGSWTFQSFNCWVFEKWGQVDKRPKDNRHCGQHYKAKKGKFCFRVNRPTEWLFFIWIVPIIINISGENVQIFIVIIVHLDDDTGFQWDKNSIWGSLKVKLSRCLSLVAPQILITAGWVPQPGSTFSKRIVTWWPYSD